MERFGLVGLPNAGKSSLFNALTNAGALAAPYAFATKDPNVGVSKVLDARLDALAEMSRSRNVVPASVQVVDIGGLVEGASKGEGLGNRFLGGIREVDAIVFVLRAFRDPDVPGDDDPLEHLRVVEIELALADLETVEGRVGRAQKAARADRSQAEEAAALEAAQLPDSERSELLEGLGLGEGALPRVAQAAYAILGRRTFLTTGDKESRAWTFRAGAKAPECAGVIHSDLQRGFIRAEVIRWDELLSLGSWQAAKEAGKLRVEGKDYEVVDGDVLEIRFNV